MFDMTEYLKTKKTTPAVLVGQNNNSKKTISYADYLKNGTGQDPNDGIGSITYITDVPVPNAPSNDPKFSNDYWDNTTWETYTPKKTTTTSTGSSGGSGGSGGTTSIVPDYKASLDDLYNKVMGYESYTPGTYTPGSTFTPNYYTPSVYQRTYDTSATEAALKAALGDIQGYKDFQYDLNGDLLYQQAVDNYSMLGQQAMADATANAAALTGGYANSYAASVGNQAYQQYLTQANNMIPQFQQMALNTWQSGFDRLLGVYDAVSQQLANELNLENMAFSIWNANESNAANAFNMNESNRYNAWAQNEQNAYNSWLANEQLKKDEWQAGYDQLLDQYNLAKDYYATLEAMQQASSSGGSSSGNKSSNNTGFWETTFDAVKNAAAQSAVLGSPYTSAQLIELIKQNQKK